MTTAIIIAGGSGSRMGQDIPKQFINVYDKPVLLYTLEGFQKHPQIDAIDAMCPPGVKHWHGATPGSRFAHLAANTNPDKPGVDWFDLLPEEEYNKLQENNEKSTRTPCRRSCICFLLQQYPQRHCH